MTFPNPLSLLRALARAARAALSGRTVMVTAKQQNRRLAICERCPRFDPLGRQCEACGCFVGLKTVFKTEACPERRWHEITLTKARLLHSFSTLCQTISKQVRRVLPPEP